MFSRSTAGRAKMCTGAFIRALFLNIEGTAMSLNRREFIVLSAALAVGCRAEGGGAANSQDSQAGGAAIDAGPVGEYSADGLYDRYRDRGFFVVRKGEKLFALSSYCTHRK